MRDFLEVVRVLVEAMTVVLYVVKVLVEAMRVHFEAARVLLRRRENTCRILESVEEAME
jgi:hypothetical protein